MAIRRSASWLLTAPVAVLAPMAHASPPDQTWIAGFYDNADYDDVISATTSAVGAIDVQILCDTKPIRTIAASTIQTDRSCLRICTLSSSPPRAPPTV